MNDDFPGAGFSPQTNVLIHAMDEGLSIHNVTPYPVQVNYSIPHPIGNLIERRTARISPGNDVWLFLYNSIAQEMKALYPNLDLIDTRMFYSQVAKLERELLQLEFFRINS